MGAYSEYYVDPSLGSDTGDGSVGTPWGRASGSVVQYALDTITRDATNGDRINVLTGTADVLSAILSSATYGTWSTGSAPLVIQGYTSAAGDGGRGEIDGNGGAHAIWDSSNDGIQFIDMKLGNIGAAPHLIGFDNYGVLIRCELHTTGSLTGAVVDSDSNGIFIGNWIHGCTAPRYLEFNAATCDYNFIDAGTDDPAPAIRAKMVTGSVCGNIVKLNHVSAGGIEHFVGSPVAYHRINNNIVYNAAAGTGTGIRYGAGDVFDISNNIVEGFSGVGGIGIDLNSLDLFTCVNNSIYNCTTAINGTARSLHEGNETLGSSPFASTTTFQLNDVGSLISGSFPTVDLEGNITFYHDRGAVQKQPGGGGGNVAVEVHNVLTVEPWKAEAY